MIDLLVDRPGLTIRRAPVAAHLLVHCGPADAAAIGTAVGVDLPAAMLTSCATGGWHALHLAPDEWLLIGAPADAPMLMHRFAAVAAPHSLVDIGERSPGLQIAGSHAVALLAAGCPLDVERMATGACTRTLFGKAMVILWRTGDGFTLEYARSFDDYVTRLARLAAEDVS